MIMIVGEITCEGSVIDTALMCQEEPEEQLGTTLDMDYPKLTSAKMRAACTGFDKSPEQLVKDGVLMFFNYPLRVQIQNVTLSTEVLQLAA